MNEIFTDLLWYMPAWWDGLTIFRAAVLGIGLAAWAVVGFFFGPWAEDRFVSATSGYVGWMVETFDRMFMEISARACVLSIVTSMVFSAAVGLVLTSGLPEGGPYILLKLLIVGFLMAGPFGLPFGYSLPRFVTKRMWNRRVGKFDQQMLDALAFMSNGLKSGLSLIQCMDMVREELMPPVSQEFGLVLNEQRLGVPIEDALINLEARIGTEDLQIMVTSINILRQSGGNLSETFDTISSTIRERQKVEGKIKSLTAQGVAQGVIIVALPFVLAMILWVMDPELIERLWTTGLGWAMLGVMLVLQSVGGFMIKKIVTIRV